MKRGQTPPAVRTGKCVGLPELRALPEPGCGGSPLKSPSRLLLFLSLDLSLFACTFSDTATHWNGCLGPNGRPVYVKTDTNVGLNFLIALPFLGHTSLPRQIDVMTREIAEEQGNTVRMVESRAENYWYGFPPFTWILTPVITTVAADYEPSAQALVKELSEQRLEKKRDRDWEQRND